MSRITEAAEEGDYTTTSELAKLLADRKTTPLRFMHFSHEGRPEYIGTWTKSSAIVGPRTPFAKDEAIDYEAEGIDAWLEEEEGEADDLASLEDDEDMDEDGDSEDDWLVSDDVVELVDGAEVQGSPHPSLSSLPGVGKRKAEDGGKQGGMKRRKLITALVPEIKGPIWEPTIGECTKVFERYRICLLNGKFSIVPSRPRCC
jgi:chromatin assembly factor 1 subunit A